MKISFLGAQEGVTGSCYYIESREATFIIDCGQFQGNLIEQNKNKEPFPFNPKDLDFILLTHGHIDHTGRLPKLVKDGFCGRIIMTRGTASLSELLLKDSAKIQEIETEKENEKRLKAGLDTIEPYYDLHDVINTLQYFNPVPYDVPYTANDITIEFIPAGHLLGSAHIRLTLENKTLLFSGDIGTDHSQILLPPKPAPQADYIFMESTYGNNLHKDMTTRFETLATIIIETYEQNGTVIIPAFSVGRTQDIIYGLKQLNDPKINRIPIYVDSPMAIHATKIFEKDLEGMRPDVIEAIHSGKHPFEMPNLQFIDDATVSYQLNYSKAPKVLISASGMCDAGRILHHLQTYLEKESTSVVFVGYQSEESLGRKIQQHESVSIYNQAVSNKAQIFTLNGFSGHADQSELLKWLSQSQPKQVFIIHGEPDVTKLFEQKIKERYGFKTHIPKLYDVIEL